MPLDKALTFSYPEALRCLVSTQSSRPDRSKMRPLWVITIGLKSYRAIEEMKYGNSSRKLRSDRFRRNRELFLASGAMMRNQGVSHQSSNTNFRTFIHRNDRGVFSFIGESLLTSLFTFLLISIRLT